MIMCFLSLLRQVICKSYAGVMFYQTFGSITKIILNQLELRLNYYQIKIKLLLSLNIRIIVSLKLKVISWLFRGIARTLHGGRCLHRGAESHISILMFFIVFTSGYHFPDFSNS